MNYTPTTWKTGDLISSSRLNHMEQGIAALYPDSSSKTIVVCPEQTVTITSENTPNNPAPIQFDSEYQGEFALPSDYKVYVNGELLEYARDSWGLSHNESGIIYSVGKSQEGSFGLLVGKRVGNPPTTFAPEPGDYTVKIELTEREIEENEIIFILKMNEQTEKWELDSCNKTPNEMYEIYDSLDSGKEADNPTIFKVRIITPYDDITFKTHPNGAAGMSASFEMVFPDEFDKKLDIIDYGDSNPYLMLSKHSIYYGASKEEIGDDYYKPEIDYNPINYKVEITKIED